MDRLLNEQELGQELARPWSVVQMVGFEPQLGRGEGLCMRLYSLQAVVVRLNEYEAELARLRAVAETAVIMLEGLECSHCHAVNQERLRDLLRAVGHTYLWRQHEQ